MRFLDGLADRKAVVILNKSDLVSRVDAERIPLRKIRVSAKNLAGIDDVKRAVYEFACSDSVLSAGLNASVSQLEELRGSLQAVREAKESLESGIGEDVCAGLLGSARMSMLRVLGLEAGDELLDSIFSRFCVGK